MKSRANLHVIQSRKGRQVDDRTPDLFSRVAETKPQSELERKLVVEPKPAQYESIQNLLAGYGLNEVNLRSFASVPNYSREIMSNNFYFLEKALTGIYNMESSNGTFGLGHEMLSRLHPAEAIAAYNRIGHLKMDGERGLNYLKSLSPSEIGKFVGSATEEALRVNHGFRVFYNKHPKLRGTSVEDRMRKLSEESSNQFLTSLSVPYRNINFKSRNFSHVLERRLPEAPSFEGIDCYINEISKIMVQVYRNNIKRMVT